MLKRIINWVVNRLSVKEEIEILKEKVEKVKDEVEIIKISEDIKIKNDKDVLEVEILKEESKVVVEKGKLLLEQCSKENYTKLKEEITSGYKYICFEKDNIKYVIEKKDINYLMFVYNEIRIYIRG